MPFAPHVRVTAIGRTGVASAERWSWSLNIGRAGGSLTIPDEDLASDIAQDIKAFHLRPASRVCSRARLQEVKFAVIGADGKYTSDPLIVGLGDIEGGDATTAQHATVTPQAALAVTLDTARRGPSGRGRFYLPMPVLSLDEGLAAGVNDVNGIRDSVVQLLNAVNNQPGLDGSADRVVVASSKGYNTPVDSVRVGRIIDTIRSRRTSLQEGYSAPLFLAE